MAAQHKASWDLLADDTRPQIEPAALADATFWCPERYAKLDGVETEETPLQPGESRWEPPKQAPRLHLLAPWRELQPRLRWGPRLQIVADRSERLVPFWTDQEMVGHSLARLLPADVVEHAAIWEGLSQPRLQPDPGSDGSRTCGTGSYRLPPPGSLLLVLGDLGCLATADRRLCEEWIAFGQRLRDAGCRPAALLPFTPRRCPAALRSAWDLLTWERSAPEASAAQLRRRAERLLRLVSPALRIEPGFLRAVRLLLPPSEADAGTEADVWAHPAVRSTSAAGATLDPEEAKRPRAAFAALPWANRAAPCKAWSSRTPPSHR